MTPEFFEYLEIFAIILTVFIYPFLAVYVASKLVALTDACLGINHAPPSNHQEKINGAQKETRIMIEQLHLGEDV